MNNDSQLIDIPVKKMNHIKSYNVSVHRFNAIIWLHTEHFSSNISINYQYMPVMERTTDYYLFNMHCMQIQ